jgi:hypothetical protein
MASEMVSGTTSAQPPKPSCVTEGGARSCDCGPRAPRGRASRDLTPRRVHAPMRWPGWDPAWSAWLRGAGLQIVDRRGEVT